MYFFLFFSYLLSASLYVQVITMTENCTICSQPFKRKSKGFQRASLQSSLGKWEGLDITVKHAYQYLLGEDGETLEGFSCVTCLSLIKKLYSRHHDIVSFYKELNDKRRSPIPVSLGRRSPFMATEGHGEGVNAMGDQPGNVDNDSGTVRTNSVSRARVKGRAAQLLTESKYSALLRHLLRKSTSFKGHMVRPVCKIIEKEIAGFNCPMMEGPASFKKLKQLNWASVLRAAQIQMPLLSGLLRICVTRPRYQFNVFTGIC